MKKSSPDIREVAFTLLSRRDLTERELAERLGRRGFDYVLIGQMIADLKEGGYINDRELCERLVHYHALEKLEGDRRIETFLRARGMDLDLITEVLRGVRGKLSEAEAAQKYVAKVGREKITVGKLIYRGFPPQLAYETLSRRPQDDDGE